MPGSARAGLGLLFMGAILMGIGSYFDRGAISFYGLIMAISGFLLYMVSSIILKRKSNNIKDH
jgi:membrane-bound ClpP family serine protease